MFELSEVILFMVASAVFATLITLLIIYLKNKKNDNKDAEEEIISIVNESHEQGMIEESEAVMINNIFELGDKLSKDIMTDRSNITAIDVASKLEDAMEIMIENSNSRFPVYMENIDQIVGIIYLKDAVRYFNDKNLKKKRIDSIEGLIREAKFIPETRKIDLLFSSMRSQRLQMVIVVDEYGQTSGIITMRDILEEIVGDIDDEYDEEDEFIVAKKDNKYVIDGLTPLEDLEDTLHIEFDNEEVETINGYLISKMEHIPDKKEKFDFEFEGYSFKVLSVENNMIKQVLVTKIETDDKEKSEAEATLN